MPSVRFGWDSRKLDGFLIQGLTDTSPQPRHFALATVQRGQDDVTGRCRSYGDTRSHIAPQRTCNSAFTQRCGSHAAAAQPEQHHPSAETPRQRRRTRSPKETRLRVSEAHRAFRGPTYGCVTEWGSNPHGPTGSERQTHLLVTRAGCGTPLHSPSAPVGDVLRARRPRTHRTPP